MPLPACAPSGIAKARGLDALVGDARIVALGEPAHGAHQPLAIRNCLFRHLVADHGFTAIALETGLTESRRLADFVAGGPGDARQVARDGFTWGFGRYQENVALIEWMRRYNQDPGNKRKLRLYGIDLSGGDGSGLWRNARITLDASLAYLARTAPALSRRHRIAIEPWLARFSHDAHAALQPREQARLRDAMAGLTRFFERHRLTLVRASSRRDYDWALRNVVLARRLEHLFRLTRPPKPDEDLTPDGYKADAARDEAMADNVDWVLKQEGTKGRILVFAHNGHIINASARGGIWSVYAQPPMSMGQHLRRRFGRMLLITPSIAGAGPSDPKGLGTLDAALARTGLPGFLLDLRNASREDPASLWLGRVQSIRANYSTEMLAVPRTAFDAVVFGDHLTPAVSVSTTP